MTFEKHNFHVNTNFRIPVSRSHVINFILFSNSVPFHFQIKKIQRRKKKWKIMGRKMK
jgi:hypothetical protein